MIPYFIFNNKNSKDYNIHIQLMPPFQSVDEEVEYLEVPGRDGYLTIPLSRKPFIEKSIEFTIFPSHQFNNIKRWLKGNGNLILSNDSDVFYKARVGGIREYWGVDKEWVSVVNFICQPWGYLHSGNNKITIINKNTKLINPEEIAKPFIKIYGTGNVDLIINNKIHKFNIDEYVEVDSELMESYKGTELKPFIGDYPILNPGENNITWDGAVSKIEVIPRWRR